MKTKAIVLLSSGLDSSVNFYTALKHLDVIAAINFDYGQRAAKKERQCSQNQCKEKKIPLIELEIPFLSGLGSSALTNHQNDLAKNINIHDSKECGTSAKNVWVPNRNGVFLNIAAAIAEGMGAKYIIPGFNAEEAASFPDNSQSYLESLNQALYYSTANQVEIFCYTIKSNKKEIYKKALELGVNFDNVWYCYESLDKACGECESCLRFENAKREQK